MARFLLFAILAAARIQSFDDASASSTNPGNDAASAISPGSASWLSALNPGDSVTWVGKLPAPVGASGVKVTWTHAPNKVRILSRSGGSASEEAAPWQAPSSAGDSFTQTISFGKIVDTQELVIVMSSPRSSGAFGIQEVALITDADAPTMFVSGASSPSELCLVAENGQQADGASVALQSCEAALAAGDGRETFLWTASGQIQSAGGKCVLLAGQKAVELGPCDETKDGRDKWSVSSTLLSSANGFCLSAQNSPRPSARATATSSADGFAPDSVLDSDKQTYWKPAQNGPSSITIELDQNVRVEEVGIDWASPASKFTIQLASTGGPWKLFKDVQGNIEQASVLHGMSGLASRVRIIVYEGTASISSVNIVQAPAQLKVVDCSQTFSDGSSSFFALPTTGVAKSTAIQAASSLFTATVEELGSSASLLVKALPQLEKCRGASFLQHPGRSVSFLARSLSVASTVAAQNDATAARYSSIVDSANAILSNYE